jgi:hypothetical protein
MIDHIRDWWTKLKARWRLARQPGARLRPLDADDKEALTFLINCAGEVIRDGHISEGEEELFREAWHGWRKARGNTP